MSANRDWIVRTTDGTTVEELAEVLGCAEPVATVLTGREYTDPETAARFLDPTPRDIHHPETLPDLADAVGRLERALRRAERIAVYADRDIDGISGAAILVTLLRDLEATVDYRVPGKWDGYGLHGEIVDELAADGTDLLVTVDCGTTAGTEIERARSAGIDVIVTDHHRVDAALPEGVACVNPRRPDSDYPHAELAGGAVAFKLGQALVESHAPTAIEAYHRYALPLAALATLGDYVRLTHENRAIVREGHDRLPECGLPGLVETARHVGVDSMRDLSWSLIPLLNAAQEDEAGEVMLELLLATDTDSIPPVLDTLERYREERRRDREEREAHLRTCFEEQVDPAADDLFFIETDRYVGGLPMSRLSAEWGRPVIAYRRSDGDYRGGGRSDPDVDFLELFEAGEEFLDDLWGHPGAAGFRLPAANLERFRERMVRVLRDRYDVAEFRPTVEIDGRLAPDEVDESLVEDLERLQPFGNGNDEPKFLLENIEVGARETFGDDDRHCKLIPADTDAFTVVHWDGADVIDPAHLPASFDIVGTVGYDSYAERPAVTISDYRLAEAPPRQV